MTCPRCATAVEAGRLCAACFLAVYGPPLSCESPAMVDRLVAKAESARKARPRTHTTTPWAQRPGLSTFDRGYGLGWS
jgi:hypothetical protein